MASDRKNVVSLTVHKNTLEKRKRRDVYKRLKECVDGMRGYPLDGFALVAFHRIPADVTDPRGGSVLCSHVDYAVRDSQDLIGMPTLASELIRERVSRNMD